MLYTRKARKGSALLARLLPPGFMADTEQRGGEEIRTRLHH